MKVVFYLTDARKKNLYCRISDGKERFTLSLGRSVDKSAWDEQEGIPKDFTDGLFDDLAEFKSYLHQKYYELKLTGTEDILPRLKQEALKLLETGNDEDLEQWSSARAKLHDLKHKHPTEKYLKAFLKFSKAKKSEIQYKPVGGHIVVLYKGVTYMISHADDFMEEYKHYFENESYDEIYTQTPEQLWEYFLNEVVSFETDELMTEIYRVWRRYWHDNREKIKGGEQRYERMRLNAFQDLQVFFQTLQIKPANALKNASAINDIELMPLIAMAIFESYENKEEFYDEVISFITEYGDDILTHGETFESVCLGNNEELDEWYYIYNPLFEFND